MQKRIVARPTFLICICGSLLLIFCFGGSDSNSQEKQLISSKPQSISTNLDHKKTATENSSIQALGDSQQVIISEHGEIVVAVKSLGGKVSFPPFSIDLSRCGKVTDADLEELKDLTELLHLQVSRSIFSAD
jgi:hypothetical protein